MANAAEEGPDIEIEHPVLVPTTLASHGQRVTGTSPRPVSAAVGTEDRLKLLFQQHRCRGLSHPVCHIRHTQNPDLGPMIHRYLNRSHRPRETAPREHPIPQPAEVVHLVGREIVDAHSIHARRSTVRSDLPPRLEHETLPNFRRRQLLLLRSIRRFLPRRIDLQTTANCPAPSHRPHYRALTATTGRSAPVPRIGTLPPAALAACGSPSRRQKPRPSLPGRQVLLFHASARDELTPPIHRTPPGPHTHSSPTEDPPRRAFVPRPPTDPSSDAIVVSFRCVNSDSHTFVFSSHTRPANNETPPAALTTPALDQRSLRRFGNPARTATPKDLPPSPAQHGSCRRSSTSPSLPFRTHTGARNSAMVVDLPRCGPILSLNPPIRWVCVGRLSPTPRTHLHYLLEAPDLGYEDGVTPHEMSPGKLTTRRYSEAEAERDAAVAETVRVRDRVLVLTPGIQAAGVLGPAMRWCSGASGARIAGRHQDRDPGVGIGRPRRPRCGLPPRHGDADSSHRRP